MTPNQKLLSALGLETVSKKDLLRLRGHLAGWSHLNEIFLLGGLTSDDLRKLIVIELVDKRRRDILRRLVTRLETQQAEELWNLVLQCLNQN